MIIGYRSSIFQRHSTTFTQTNDSHDQWEDMPENIMEESHPVHFDTDSDTAGTLVFEQKNFNLFTSN